MSPRLPRLHPRALFSAFGGGLPANFWRLWISSVSANLADGIVAVAIPLIAVSLTRSPAEIAAVTIASRIPNIAVGLLAGGLADRLDRRWTMLAVQLLRFTVITVLAAIAVAGALSMPVLYATALVIGTGEAFFDTNAQAIIPALVGRDRLVTANGRLFAAETMMNAFVGPPLGGLLIAVSVPLALSAGALGFLLAAVGLLLIAGGFRSERTGPGRRLHADIAEGIGFLARHPLLRTLSGMVAMGRLGSAGFFALLALYAVAPGPMGLSEPQYGLLFVTFGIGSLIGSFVATQTVSILGRPNVLAGAQLLFGLVILVPALTANALVIGAGFFAGGIAIMAWNITNVSLRQSLLPSSLMGRVHATHRTLANLAEVIGAFAAGLIAEAFGLRVAFAVGAAVIIVSVAGRLIVTDDRIRAAEATAEAT
ncbi:MAG: MFS transporter [Chloroflexi bacterium]|nr:MFS transporter [Chloroflexota bacterium]